MRGRLAVMVLAAVVAGAGQAHARRPEPAPGAPGQIDCAVLATMPNAPMTREACEQMMAGANAMQRAMDDPAGQRPGDEEMTCDQIKAELMTQQNVAPNSTLVAEGQSAAADYRAKAARVQGEATAMAAQQTAVGVAAAAASAVPGVGNAVAGAAAASQAASQAAFAAHASAELTPAERRLFAANSATMSDIALKMQANPRVARLSSLAMKKDCH